MRRLAGLALCVSLAAVPALAQNGALNGPLPPSIDAATTADNPLLHPPLDSSGNPIGLTGLGGGGGGGASASAAFAGTHGPVTSNFAIFASLYTALFSPFQASVATVAGSISGTVAGWVTTGVVLMIMIFCAAFALQAEGGLFDRLLTRVLIPAAIALFILQGHYDQFVIQPASTFADSIGNAIVGGVGGTAINGGAPFDKIWNIAFGAGTAAFNALPWSLMGLALFIAIVLYWFAAAISIGLAFVMFITSKILLELLLAIGPLFIAFGAFQFTRFLLKGYVSALASVICAQIIVLALLAVSFNIENTILAPIILTVANANIWGVIETLLVAGVLLGGCAILACKSAAIAVGICGGIFDGIAPWIAGASAAYRASHAGPAASAAAHQTMRIVRPSTAAGRNMSGP